MTSSKPDFRASASIHRFRISRAPQNTLKPRRVVERSTEPAYSACDRCRRQKKKCSRTRPKCDQCVHSAAECSYREPTVVQLEAKVRQLTKFIEDSPLSDLPAPIPNDEGPQDGEAARALPLEGNPSTVHREGGANGLAFGQIDCASVVAHSIAGSEHSISAHDGGGLPKELPSVKPNTKLPPDAACNRFVDAYFRHVHRIYPFIDKSSIVESLQSASDLAQYRRDPGSKKLVLVMAIGCTTLQRAGQIPSETSARFRIPYGEIVEDCLNRASIESVEALFLLCLYSLFDPSGMSPWSLVGLLTRQAMAIGITRKASGSGYQVELRNRLYWSIFVLDRMLSTSLGLPFGFNDENSDIPLPSIVVEEFDTTERTSFATSLQVCRHVVQLRQLEDTIMKTIHLANARSIGSLSTAAKDAIQRDLRRQVDDWYSHGCLLTPSENDNIPFHNTITWLTVRYYHLLILLYSPSHFTSVSEHYDLQRFVQKYLQSSCVLLQQRQLPLNWVTLYRFLSIFSILLYCFVRNEVQQSNLYKEITTCAEILEAFPSTWTVAARSALVFRQFSSLVSSGTALGADPWDKGFSQVKSDSMGLVREILGSNSAFCFADYLTKHPVTKTDLQLLGIPESVLGGTQEQSSLNALGGESTQDWYYGMDYFQ